MSAAVRADALRPAVARLDAAIGHVALVSAMCAGAALVLMIGHVILEIVLRTAFATSTFALDEFVGYGVAAVTFLSAGYAFQDDAFIRVGLALEATRRNEALRRALELACAAITGTAVWFVAWHFARSVARHLERGTVSETVAQVPLWIPEGLMLIGLVVLGLRIVVYVARVACGAPLLDAHLHRADGDQGGA